MVSDEVVEVDMSRSGTVERIRRARDGTTLTVRSVLHHWIHPRLGVVPDEDLYVTEAFRLMVAPSAGEAYEVTIMNYGRAAARAWHMRPTG